ncbi:hypothetical protein D3C72_1325850 [compost metagenome]
MLLHAAPGGQRAFHVAARQQHVARQDGGAHALAVRLQGFFQQRHGVVRLHVHEGVMRQFAIELGDFFLARTGARFLQAHGRFDGAWPFLFALIDFQQRAACLGRILRVDQAVEGFFGAVQQACFQVIHAQLIGGMALLFQRQVRARQQVLVHANRALRFAAAAEQVAQREVHIGRFRVQLDDFDEGVDGLVMLLIKQEIQALEIIARQAARFGHQLMNVHTRGNPAQREKHRDTQEPPEFKIHAIVFIRVREIGATAALTARSRCPVAAGHCWPRQRSAARQWWFFAWSLRGGDGTRSASGPVRPGSRQRQKSPAASGPGGREFHN